MTIIVAGVIALARLKGGQAKEKTDLENLAAIVLKYVVNAVLAGEFLIPNAPAALALLVRLAGSSKAEWRALIDQLEIDVPVKATDSVRDILGRLLKHLSDNRDIEQKLVEKAKKAEANVSPELMKALSILM